MTDQDFRFLDRDVRAPNEVPEGCEVQLSIVPGNVALWWFLSFKPAAPMGHVKGLCYNCAFQVT